MFNKYVEWVGRLSAGQYMLFLLASCILGAVIGCGIAELVWGMR